MDARTGMKKILIIQPAFPGDVILATALVHTIAQAFPESRIDFLCRKGNEHILKGNPFIHQILIRDRKKNFSETIRLIRLIRKNKYSDVINVHRFFISGLFTVLSGAKNKSGFDKNPWSFAFGHVVRHELGNLHETERNHLLLKYLNPSALVGPRLFPEEAGAVVPEGFDPAQREVNIALAPSSVWETKRLPVSRWIELVKHLGKQYRYHLIGAPEDAALADQIIEELRDYSIAHYCGKSSFLQSALLVKHCRRLYTNDSAPAHIGSAVGTPVSIFYLSTLREFGFWPLSEGSEMIETKQKLTCRPCGIHGKKTCPEKHFNCAYTIDIASINHA